MSAHARLAPSSAHRWMACPGSIRMVEALPASNYSSEYADLGTAAHELFEMCMRLEDDPHQWLGRTIAVRNVQHPVDQNMADAVGHACDYVRGYLAAFPRAVWHGEQRSNAGILWARDDVWGTSDTIIDNRAARELVVMDYKHGAGVYVEVADNEQLLIYALGYMAKVLLQQEEEMEASGVDQEPPWETVTLVIVQPRAFGPGGPVRTQTITLDDLVAFGVRLRHAVQATDDPFAPLVAGDHCRFCPASSKCPALAEHAISVAKQEFVSLEEHMKKDVVPEQPLMQLGVEDFAWLLKQVPVIRAWCNSVESAAEVQLLRGGTLPGFKLVRGRKSYSWALPEQDVKYKLITKGLTEDQVAPRSLVSPAQARDMLGGKSKKSVYTMDIAPTMVRVNEGKLTIAPDTDPRPAANPVDVEFNPLDNDEDLLA